MAHPISLSIFFPTYNEEENIRQTITRTVRVADESPLIGDYEIIIVNDGSSDNTLSVAEKLAHEFPAVRLVNHPVTRGYGAALKSGISAALKEYVFFTDADLQFDIVELQNLLVHAGSHDAVIGYRAPRRDPFMRLVIARGWNMLNKMLFGLHIRDIDCAFKLFRRADIQELQLHSSGAMISAETLIRLTRQNLAVKEVPVSHLPRTAGSPTGAKPSVIARAFAEMLQLYRGELGLPTHKQALKFLAVGILNTALDATIYFTLTRSSEMFADHLLGAKLISFLAGTVSSLLLNRAWTFGLRSRPRAAEIARFYAAASIALAVNVTTMHFLLSLHVYDLIALIITTVATFAINFTLSKFWVFRRNSTHDAPTGLQSVQIS